MGGNNLFILAEGHVFMEVGAIVTVEGLVCFPVTDLVTVANGSHPRKGRTN